MKGRNTRCISIRLPEVVIFALDEKASSKGFKTASEYIKSQLLKSVGYSDDTTNEGIPPPSQS